MLNSFDSVALFFFKTVCVCLLGGFSVIGLLQGIKQVLPAGIKKDKHSNKYLALANFIFCGVISFCVWHSLYREENVKYSFIFLLYGGVLSAAQLGYEGLVKPAFDAILSRVKSNT